MITIKEGLTGRSGSWSGKVLQVEVDLDNDTVEDAIRKARRPFSPSPLLFMILDNDTIFS